MSASLFFTSDGKTLFYIRNNNVTIWDVNSCMLCCTCSGSLIGISSDEKVCLIHSEKKRVQAYDLSTGGELLKNNLKAEDFAYHQHVIISKSGDAELIVRDVFETQPTKRVHLSERLYGRAKILRIPNERYIALDCWWDSMFGGGNILLIHDIETGKQILQISESEHLSFSGEHNLFIVAQFDAIVFYDPSTGKDVGGVEHQPLNIAGVSLDPKNKLRMAVAAGRKIQLINLHHATRPSYPHGQFIGESASQLREANTIAAIAFHPDGEQIACALKNGTIHIWDMTTCTVTCELTR